MGIVEERGEIRGSQWIIMTDQGERLISGLVTELMLVLFPT